MKKSIKSISRIPSGAVHFAITPIVSWSWGIEGPHMRGGKYAPPKIIWQIDANGATSSGDD
jgi:hypothetical protein